MTIEIKEYFSQKFLDFLGRIIAPPLIGFPIIGWGFFQVAGPAYSTTAVIVGLVATITLAVIANVTKLALGLKTASLTRSQNTDNTAIQVLKMSQEETARAIEAEKVFWTRRIDEVRNQLVTQQDDKIKFWVGREEKVREEKHESLNKCTAISLELDLVKLQIKQYGAFIDSQSNIIWPTFIINEQKVVQKLLPNELHQDDIHITKGK